MPKLAYHPDVKAFVEGLTQKQFEDLETLLDSEDGLADLRDMCEARDLDPEDRAKSVEAFEQSQK